MNEKDWIEEVSGKSWQDRATGPDAYDCWGLVVDFFHRVYGVDVECISGYQTGKTGIDDGFDEKGKDWHETACGYVAVCFDSNDNASHVGVRIGNRVIHAFGSPTRRGQVFNHTLAQFTRIYRSKVKFFDYERV